VSAIANTFDFSRGLSPEVQARLFRDAQLSKLPAGADILHPGDIVDGVYLVTSGAIRVYYLDEEGREGTLYWIEPGESCILALNSLFSEIPYPAWAAADAEGVEILSVPGAAFKQVFSTEPSAQAFLFEQLSGRVFSLLRLLENSMRLPQEKRLVALLLDRAQDGVVSLSQEALARHLGTAREVVSRLLRNLAAQGLIKLAPRRIELLDTERLRRFSD
jgi:CRP/FNR family transcriptional regulator